MHNRSKGGLGYKSKFAFKWIPDLVNIETPQGEPFPGRTKTLGGLRHRGVERTALLTLLFVGALLGFIAWLGVRIVAAAAGADMQWLGSSLEQLRFYGGGVCYAWSRK